MWYLLTLLGIVLFFVGFMPGEFSSKYEVGEKSPLLIGLGLFICIVVCI